MRRHNYSVVIVASLLSLGTAYAEDRPLDVTIKVLESPGDTPDTVTRTIKLPPAASRRPGEIEPGHAEDRREVESGPHGDRGADAGRDTRGSSGRGGGGFDDGRSQAEIGRGKDKNKDKGRGRP